MKSDMDVHGKASSILVNTMLYEILQRQETSHDNGDCWVPKKDEFLIKFMDTKDSMKRILTCVN